MYRGWCKVPLRCTGGGVRSLSALCSGREERVAVELSERAAWSRLDEGGRSPPATRQDLMTVLSSVDAILVRATFSDRMQSTFLKNVVLDTAISAVSRSGAGSDT